MADFRSRLSRFAQTFSRVKRSLISYTVKPVALTFARTDRYCFADENEKGSLKGIFDIMMVIKDATAHTPDQWRRDAAKRGTSRDSSSR